eukprot:1363425-Pyramimonas_sp.AAC.1
MAAALCRCLWPLSSAALYARGQQSLHTDVHKTAKGARGACPYPGGGPGRRPRGTRPGPPHA